MVKRLEGKVAIVTGAGSSGPGWGNGKACAVQFAREGASVFAVDIDKSAAAETEAIIREILIPKPITPKCSSRPREYEEKIPKCKPLKFPRTG